MPASLSDPTTNDRLVAGGVRQAGYLSVTAGELGELILSGGDGGNMGDREVPGSYVVSQPVNSMPAPIRINNPFRI